MGNAPLIQFIVDIIVYEGKRQIARLYDFCLGLCVSLLLKYTNYISISRRNEFKFRLNDTKKIWKELNL